MKLQRLEWSDFVCNKQLIGLINLSFPFPNYFQKQPKDGAESGIFSNVLEHHLSAAIENILLEGPILQIQIDF